MKKILLVLFSLAVIAFASCKKEYVEPKTDTSQETIDTTKQVISIYGKWKLLDGYMYVENLATGTKTRYSHFSATQNFSSLRYGGAIYNIETIEKGMTTWEFTNPNKIPGYGKFILNSDATKLYGFYVTNNNWTIVEDPSVTNASQMNLGGSSRPVRAYIANYAQNTCKFYVEETYENINGYNCKYFNELLFQKIQ